MSLAGLVWCGLFFLAGPTLILFNNYVFNTIQFKYPILFSSLGTTGVVIVTHVGASLGWVTIEKSITIRFWITRIIPIGLLAAATTAAGNSVYLYLSVSFTQMLKSLSPVYILACLALFRVKTPSRIVVASVFVISLGAMIAAVGEIHFAWTGFILQTISELFEASRVVLLQIILTENFSPIESMYYISPATALCQFCLVLVYERNALFSPISWGMYSKYWYFFLLAMALGTCVNFVSINVIKHTSGLMLKLLGIIRNICLVLFSILFLGETSTAIQIVGYMTSVVGFFWYTKLTSEAASSENVKYSQVNDEKNSDEEGEEMEKL